MTTKPPSVSRALAGAVRAAGLERTDVAAVALAKRYAHLLDEGNDEALADFGPKLLAVLVELKLTPKARSAVLAGGGAPGAAGGQRAALHALRQRTAGQD